MLKFVITAITGAVAGVITGIVMNNDAFTVVTAFIVSFAVGKILKLGE